MKDKINEAYKPETIYYLAILRINFVNSGSKLTGELL